MHSAAPDLTDRSLHLEHLSTNSVSAPQVVCLFAHPPARNAATDRACATAVREKSGGRIAERAVRAKAVTNGVAVQR